ncbi:MAG: O-methyltransferase [Bacillota bacterium]
MKGKNQEYIDNFINNVSFQGDFLEEMRKDARERNIPVMLKDTAVMLATQVRSIKPKKILEIGTAIGYSGSLMMFSAPPDATLVTLEKMEESREEAIANFTKFGQINRVKCYLGDCTEIIPQMSGEFDFILLDGPKSKYLEMYPYLKDMLKSGGMLFSDNVLFRDLISGEKKHTHRKNTIVRNMREFLDMVSKDKDMVSTLLDIGDGIMLSIKK